MVFVVLPPDVDDPTREVCPSGLKPLLGTRCFHDAFIGGLDGRWRSQSAEYVVARWELMMLTVRRLALPKASAATDATEISVIIASARMRLVPASEF